MWLSIPTPDHSLSPNLAAVAGYIAILTSAFGVWAQPAFAGSVSGPVNPCYCPTGPCASCNGISAISKQMLCDRMTRAGYSFSTSLPTRSAPLGSLSLLGEINGEWTEVDAYVAYTQDFSVSFPDVGRLQVLLRGYQATRESNTNRCRVDWDRRIYWLNFDGDGPGIPHVLGALEFAAAYVPDAGDFYPEFNSIPAVVQQCTLARPCSVNWTPYVLYRD